MLQPVKDEQERLNRITDATTAEKVINMDAIVQSNTINLSADGQKSQHELIKLE